jgi:hypothetical protein
MNITVSYQQKKERPKFIDKCVLSAIRKTQSPNGIIYYSRMGRMGRKIIEIFMLSS